MHATSLQGIANLCLIHEYLLLNSVNLYAYFTQNPSVVITQLLIIIMYWINRINGRAVGDQGKNGMINKIYVALTDITRYIATCFRSNPIITETLQNAGNMSNLMRLTDAAEIF
jgi:hypothetical protein